MRTLKLIAVGDTSLQTKDNTDPFQNIGEAFETKNVLFGNLEAVLSSTGKKAKKAQLMYSPPENVKFLKDAGFDVLNVANNHIIDLGIEGIKNTITLLTRCNLACVGASSEESGSTHSIIDKGFLRLGFLAYTTGRFSVPRSAKVNKLKKKRILSDIAEIRRDCDIIIISLHWGTENAFYPSPDQIKFAHTLIDSGASLVLGHHPHVLQGIEKYKNGLIAYSLGNFNFDPTLSQTKTPYSAILSVNVSNAGIESYEVHPVKIDASFAPIVVEGSEKDDILQCIDRISRRVEEQGVTEKWWFEQIAHTYLQQSIRSYVARTRKYGIQPLFEALLWSMTPFCLRCYAAILRNGSNKRHKEPIAIDQ